MAQLTYRSVWRLAGPNIASNVLMVMISFAHLWIIAPYGSEASAAVVAGGRIHFLLMSASIALSIATTALVARAWGADDVKDASAATASSLVLATLIAIILGAVTYVSADQAIALFDLDAKTSALAADFVKPAALLNFVFALAMTIATAFRAIGDVLRPLRFTAFATAFGIAGSYMLVHGTFGLPKLGVAGLAWGTAAGQGIVVSWFLFRWLAGGYIFKPLLREGFDRSRFKRLLKLGTPAAVEQVVIQSSFIIFLTFVAAYGTPAFAAYGIGITILSLCIVIGMGFGAASATLSGQNLGASNPEAARASGWIATKMAVACMSFVALGAFVFRSGLASLLSVDPEVRAYTEFFIIILAIIQPLMAIEFTIGSALRGGGETRFPLLVTFMGILGGRFALGALVVLFDGPVEAIYSVIIADYLIKAIMLVVRFRSDAWIKTDLDEASDDRAEDKIPLVVQSIGGVVLAPIRAYFAKRRLQRPDNK